MSNVIDWIWNLRDGANREAPNSKRQITNNFQCPNSKSQTKDLGHSILKFGAYLGFGI
jgi:hypothetical protein